MDINGDKEIEFPEFIFGMCAWVGMEDDDDEADDYSLLSPQVNAKSFRNDFKTEVGLSVEEHEELAEEVAADES